MILIPDTQFDTPQRFGGHAWVGPICIHTPAITSALRQKVIELDRDDVFLFDLVGDAPRLLSLMREVILAGYGTRAKPSAGLLCSLDPISVQSGADLLKAKPYALEHSDKVGARHLLLGAGITGNPLYRTFLTNLAPKSTDAEIPAVFDVVRTHMVPA
jgi:hypothetical protein